MSKSELAVAAGVTPDTFRKWLKTDKEVLTEMGIAPQQHILPPHAVRYLCEKYNIEPL